LPVDWISFDEEMAYTAGPPLSATRRGVVVRGPRMPRVNQPARGSGADSGSLLATGIEIELIGDGLHRLISVVG
jgi:hypothetical protein